MQESQPAQPPFLIGPQLTAESLGCRQRIRRLLLVVLLKHRLQPGTGVELVHRQPHQQFALCAGESQGVIQAQFRLGAAEPFSVLEVVGPQFDPGPLVADQRAAFSAQPLQFPEGQRDPPDHQIPAPVEGFTKREAAGALRQLRFDRQAQPAGEPPREAGGQFHPNAGIPKLPGCGSHQHECLSRCELHRLRR
ncbi:MAG: Uncharacterised protein [Synechococcus sp. CC9902]|nr:MAG: Uncharacterised protein [Synechococcus sp. CC9902]